MSAGAELRPYGFQGIETTGSTTSRAPGGTNSNGKSCGRGESRGVKVDGYGYDASLLLWGGGLNFRYSILAFFLLPRCNQLYFDVFFVDSFHHSSAFCPCQVLWEDSKFQGKQVVLWRGSTMSW